MQSSKDLGKGDEGVFTWSGGPNNQSWARLDRFLVNTSWLDQFSGVLQRRLPRPLSDHFPVLLEGGGLRRGPSPFRFENMWLKVEGFQDLIRSWCLEQGGFGNLGCNKAAALQQVEFWDLVESDRILSVEETELKKEAKENYKKWVLLEETHWRQLSREIWLREGDRNTGYFHRMANANRRNNYLDRIKIDGGLSEEQEVREGIANAYQQMLSEVGWQADIGRLRLDQISHQEAENLEAPFSEAEVHSALMEMNGDKAPGPDGFTVAFWQSCWGFVKEEILAMFKEFHEQNTFLKSLNNTFLVLIPKKVNGVPAGFFPSSKGLRQGDPLSPYLFVMGMEVLGLLLGELLKGIPVRDHLSHLSWILFWFEAASGLKINLGKSEIIPVGAPNKASSVWDGVEERVRRRLALWKRQFISKGGRITLIKSTLASIPIYQMSLFRMPKIVVRRLEKLQRDFLWGGGNMERKIHLVKWEIVCGDKERGGLGLRKLGLLNRALLGKWIWRFACERENLWKQVIVAKFGQEDDGWKSKKPNGAFCVGVWKEIMKETDWCWDNIEFMVGKGTKIRFWTDVWCAGTALSQTFPHLFALAANRNATVEEMWDQNSDQGGWNLRF
ncbi:putative ribonuclease H protein [Vitis vinifera]|uniref:Putative ribonuclease H protein n=1 Tax=Vitis vinifera TaxID=29760 RepID=A0A438BPF4_VITVI|nr:putative ribonuclease H protein [Vitis vinifera]